MSKEDSGLPREKKIEISQLCRNLIKRLKLELWKIRIISYFQKWANGPGKIKFAFITS